MSLLAANSGVVPGKPTSRTGASFTLTFTPQPGEQFAGLCRRMAERVKERAAVPLHLLIFGNTSAAAAGSEVLTKYFGRLDFPVTWVEGADCNRQPVAGVQLYAFTGEVGRIQMGGRVVGSVFTEGTARQCLVGGLMHWDKTLSPAKQTGQALETLQMVLARGGFDLADTVRTWFYLDNILRWYDDFNRARTAIYSNVKFCTGSLPASTGVGAKNSADTALALAAWAFRPVTNADHAEEIASPLQCPAPAYGSSFSRAMEISCGNRRRLFISGTASIAPGGKTLWFGDVGQQIELTMDVVEAIIRSRGHSFDELARATAYFRHASDGEKFTRWLAVNGHSQWPLICAQCDVCRDDLLFELEAELDGAA